MTNYIKPGSQAPFENSILSVTKTTRHLDKMFSNAFYAKKTTSNCFSERTSHTELFASNKRKHRGSCRSNIILLAEIKERLLIFKMQTCLNTDVSHSMRNKELIDTFLLMLAYVCG